MKEIPLTRGYVAIVDDEDFERFGCVRWAALVTKRATYAQRRVGSRTNGRIVLLHREIMGAERGMEVDHIDGDGLNNRRGNLRTCSHKDNIRSSHKWRIKTASRFKGVVFAKWAGKKGWRASITIDRRNRHLGYFASEEEAASAYDNAARVEFGVFARLNFPTHGEVTAHG